MFRMFRFFSMLAVFALLGGASCPVNHAPVAHDQAVSTEFNTAVGVVLEATDEDGDQLHFRLADLPQSGSLTGSAPNLTYNPNSGFSGEDRFTFIADDGTVDSNTATVTVTVRQQPGPVKPDLGFLTFFSARPSKMLNVSLYHYNPTTGQEPTEDEARAQLQKAYAAGFRGIILYGSSGINLKLPRIAKEIGFQVVGAGIWDPSNAEEVANAIAQKAYVSFYDVGSEGIYRGGNPYSKSQLIQALGQVQQATGLAVTTSEPWSVWLNNMDLADSVDFISVNIYGWWDGLHEPQAAANALAEHYGAVKAAAGSKPVVVRETGFPTGGHPEASVQKQRQYFQALDKTDLPYAFFEFADQYWKSELDGSYDIGPVWGRWDKDGNDKWVNHAPTAQNQSATCPPNGQVQVTLGATDPDGDPLVYTVVSGPAHGNFALTGAVGTYTPAAGYSGGDEFKFKANDGTADSNPATVSITVEPSGLPSLSFTYVPPLGSFASLQGSTANVDYTKYAVVIYIKVNGTWWVKPYTNQPLTSILPSGSWSCDITTGGVDETATEIRGFVVLKTWTFSGTNTLPNAADYVASTSATR